MKERRENSFKKKKKTRLPHRTRARNPTQSWKPSLPPRASMEKGLLDDTGQDLNFEVFLNTQVQANLDDWEKEDLKAIDVGSFKSSIAKYGLAEEESLQEIDGFTVKKSGKRSYKKPRKPASITGLMTEKHAKKNTVLRLLSGKKRKVNEIISKLEQIEANSQHSEPDSGSPKMVYTRSEWYSLMKIIRVNFPNLSKPSRLSLLRINAIYEQSLSQASQNTSLWAEASTLPEARLSEQDLRWLYDLGESDGFELRLIGDFSQSEAFTLSQIVRDHQNEVGMTQLTKDGTPISTPSKNRVIEVPSSSPRTLPVKLSPGKLASLKSLGRCLKRFEPQVDVMTSMVERPRALKRFSTVLDSTAGSTQANDENTQTTFMTPENDFSDSFKATEVNQLENLDLDASSGAFYSTARSTQPVLKTTKYEFKGRLKDGYTSPLKGIEARVEYKKRARNENVIPDSESDDDQDISVIEITKVVPSNEQNKDANEDVSEIQVPSSPPETLFHENLILPQDPVPEYSSLISKLSLATLKILIDKWEIRGTRTKRQMVKLIETILHLLLQDGKGKYDLTIDREKDTTEQANELNEKLSSLPLKPIHAALCDNITKVVKEDRHLYETILTYQPISLEKLSLMLEKRNMCLDVDTLRFWAAKTSTTYSLSLRESVDKPALEKPTSEKPKKKRKKELRKKKVESISITEDVD